MTSAQIIDRTVIWWIRRDLRLVDNQPLQAALESGSRVVPTFILDSRLLHSRYVGEKRLAFLFAGLRELDAALRSRGSCLVLRQGDPLSELGRLMEQTGAQRIFAEPDYSPYSRRRDAAVERGFPVHWAGSPAVLPPGAILKPDGAPYTVFTPFSKAWKLRLALPPGPFAPAPHSIPTPAGLEALQIPSMPVLAGSLQLEAGEEAAMRRLEWFSGQIQDLDQEIRPIHEYASARDRLDLDGTSKLSPYLRFGMLSARRAARAALDAIENAPHLAARRGAESWLNEIIWRDFYLHILHHFPQVRTANFRLPDVRWENDPSHLEAWQAGKTGYPVVDAAMRQLETSGWMHNRARMITASFLTKDLLVDWRLGEQWFMRHLIDGDPASNNGGWQWAAGTGTDAAPYFRIFNPVLQGLKHDPQGAYIRRWLPELVGVPDEHIHQPWKMPLEVQRSCDVVIGRDYPAPLVDHEQSRQRALRAYRQVASGGAD